MLELKYDCMKLRLLHEDLVEALQNSELELRAQEVAGKVQQCCQMVIWGDKQNPDFFEFFLENKVTELLFDMFTRSKRRELLVSIISSLAKLVSNLTRPSLQLLLASPALLNFQIIKFGQVTQDVAEYYVNFLKALSQKLDEELVHLLYNQVGLSPTKRYPQFALAWQSIRFYNHPETLIKTTCRNIVLSLFKIKEPHVVSYLGEFPFVTFYSHITSLVREHWLHINRYMDKSWVIDQEKKRALLAETIQDHYDLVLFLEDAIRTSTAGGQYRIANCILNGMLAEGLSYLYRTLTNNSKQLFDLNFVVYIVGVLFRNCSEPLLADILALLFFGRHQLKQVDSRLRGEQEKLASYSTTWSFKHFWDSFDDQLFKYNRENYERVSRSMKQEKSQLEQLNTSIDLMSMEPHVVDNSATDLPIFASMPSFLGLNKSKFEVEFAKLSSLYGLEGEKTTVEYLVQVREQLRQELPLDLTQFDENSAKNTLLLFLTSKDDILVNNALDMMLAFLKCKQVSPAVMRYCGLYPHEKSREFYTRTNFQKLVRLCIEILRLDPMTYRLCTLRNAAQLITLICRPYIGDPEMLTEQLRADLILVLKISVEKVKVDFETYKGLVSMVQIFERSQKELNRHRPKSLAYTGIVQVGTESHLDLYEKFVYTPKEEIERNFCRFYLTKRLMEEIKIKPVEQYVFLPALEKDTVYSKRFIIGKEVEVTNEHNIQCLYRQGDEGTLEKRQDTAQPSCLMLLSGYMLMVEICKDKPTRGYVRFNTSYHSISRLTIEGEKNQIVRIKVATNGQPVILQLHFENYKGSTATKLRLEDCRQASAKLVFSQINSALNKSIQECSVKAG